MRLLFFEIDIGGSCELVTKSNNKQKAYELFTDLIIKLICDDYNKIPIEPYERTKEIMCG